MKKTLVSILTLSVISTSMLAKDYTPADYKSETHPDLQVIDKIDKFAKNDHKATASMPQKKSNAVKVNAQNLLANPSLLRRAMRSVVLTKQIEGISVILPIYQKLADADPLLITYAKGLLAHSNGQFDEAINHYRKIIASNPEMSVVRLDLATALYTNQQKQTAYDQLKKLQSEPLPPNVEKMVGQMMMNIEREQDWQWNANFYVRNERNINNAPKEREINYKGGKITTPQPEKAQGIHLDLSASKRFNLKGNFYSNLQLDLNSDLFWNNHKYDDVSAQLGVGIGYQTAKFTAEIQPFAKKRFYATDPYSVSYGASGFESYQFTPRFKLSNNWSWEYEKFDTRKHLNGQRQFLGLSAFFMRNSQQYWLAGINLYNKQARDQDDAFIRKGAYIGLGQEWQGGLSSKLILSLGKRDYKGVDIFNIKRSDKEYSAKVSLWHRNWHWLGVTPRLVLSWNKTSSNHFLYNTQDSKVNIEFSRSF
ncbi:surface lipoprotein assembly modifier [Pasteurella atlantica]|uniref:surface lipoprotein assembly modifier n=1 Tax=Pasteurellaceae TaxID=712 RepID=UPI0027760ABB|nr:surface lipoprotein assembly modifier [Pasteurella atlantica]MDP8099132.1 surface lipoprotein assembly modifier [Pasteurella atlantica]MDP8107158.1 surface lipoprotein assembly modifier [Pasteurella atlantica]MDP8116849.1 surface lipoprotein assembly modifier [Pasteurella atlantica]